MAVMLCKVVVLTGYGAAVNTALHSVQMQPRLQRLAQWVHCVLNQKEVSWLYSIELKKGIIQFIHK